MLHRRTCEVRVSQARHLVAKERKRNGDDKLLVADVVWVLMSVDGKHNTTEGCRDIDNPSWQRVATFDVDLRDPGEGSKDARQGASSTAHASRKQQQQPQPRQKKNNSASATLDRSIASRLAPSATAMEQKTENFAAGKRPSSSSNPFAAEVVPETQSLNPFASNFVPPPSSPPTPPKAPPPAPPPPPSPPAKLRTSLVLHLRVLNGRLSAKEVLGDVAVDLVPLLRSGGERLATDRLGWLRSEDCMPLERLVQSDGDGGAAPVAVDTWVSLRQGNAELRVQLRIRPAAGLQEARAGGEGRGPRRMDTSCTCDETAWGSAFDSADEEDGGGLAKKTSLDLEQRSLDERLLEVQELYDFSATTGYREGKPDEDGGGGGVAGQEGGGKDAYSVAKVPEWPHLERDAAKLRRDMQFAALRNRRQSIAWAAKLGSSAELQQALRHPPPYGARNGHRNAQVSPLGETKRGNPSSATGSVAEPGSALEDLKELVAQGIPAKLREMPTAAMVGSRVSGNGGLDDSGGGGGSGRMGGAFMMGKAGEGEEGEAGFLNGVVTSIPRVEVTRVTGTICCAEYQLQVKRPRGDSWFVLRRYSDFVQLYSHLPRNLHAPMPPKSWRSISFLSMTPEFLEERRVALEVALRRLVISAVQSSDAVVQADLRAFLGFPPCAGAGAGRLTGVDAAVARHLTRVPPDLELSLPAGTLPRISLLGDLRVVMWMLMSGAAHKASVTEDREQYVSLVAVGGEADWCREGGSADDYALAALAFPTIQSDVNRTNVSSSAERERLRRVLRAFALKEPRTAYCQGMNSVALFLLRTAGGREDVAFWLLDALATAVIRGHWEQLSHIATAGDGAVTIRMLLEKRAPALLEHLDQNLPPEVLLCDFMLSLGCRSLPPTTLLRCFDLMFSEGGDALVYITLAILRLAEDKLLGVQGAPATSETLMKCAASMHDADLVIEMARSNMVKGVDQSGAGSKPGNGVPRFDVLALGGRHKPP